MAEQLAPLERLSQEELWKVANELDLRGLARLARCSKALRAALCPRPEAWRGALRTVAGKSAVHDAPDPRRAAKAVVTLGEARWARINPGLQYDLTAPTPREQFVEKQLNEAMQEMDADGSGAVVFDEEFYHWWKGQQA